ncbi:hypothetical protein GCM10009642_52060 [Nocardiopsis metallicus]
MRDAQAARDRASGRKRNTVPKGPNSSGRGETVPDLPDGNARDAES